MSAGSGGDLPSTSRGASSAVGIGGVVAELPGGMAFAAVPLTDCPHLRFVEELPSYGVNTALPCATCNDLSENWICLTCYTVFCSRYVNGHGVQHFQTESHPMALSFSDLSAWCYECCAYVHNAALMAAKNAAYISKFGRLPTPRDESLNDNADDT